MDPERQRIAEDLRGQLAGEVLADDLQTQLYATDASAYEIRPQVVVRPRMTADVVATVRYAAEAQLPIHARGAGSGLAGGCVGPGIVIDFSRFMRRVVSHDANTVCVQPGVIHGELNRVLATRGKVYGPDPAQSEVTTMGGVLSVDASGSHWLHYGSARDSVKQIKAVLADGETIELPSPLDTPRATQSNRVRQLATAVGELFRRRRDVIDNHRVKVSVDTSGYALGLAANEDQVDLAKLLVGSEGTLALITEATLSTHSLPSFRGSLLLVFDSLDKAARSVEEILPLGPAACDLMDRRHLSLARETDVRYELMIPAAAEAVLLVEHFAESEDELSSKLDATVRVVREDQNLAAGCYAAEGEQDEQLLWSLARRFVPTLHSLKGARRAVTGIEDIAVPPAALPVFLHHLQDTLKQRQITASLFGHAGHGQLHIRPLLDLSQPGEVQRFEVLTSELYEKVWLLGGTISGEHGDGLSRTPFLPRQHGPLLNVFRELKRIFDPAGLLNPGKIVAETPSRMSHHMRRNALPQTVRQVSPESPSALEDDSAAVPSASEPIELQLHWQPAEMAHTAVACNGCGTCRTSSAEVRMCPIFRFAPREESSPRAKANLARAVATGLLPREEFTRAEAKQVADLCVHCHMCRQDCPAGVDIPKLMLEAKAAYVASNGLQPNLWWLTRIDRISRWASRMPRLANWMLGDARARWLMEKTLGLAQGRQMPHIATRPFLQHPTARRHRTADREGDRKVLYFVDTFANYYDDGLAEALVSVLKHNNVSLYIPAGQSHSGMPMITQGDLTPARQIAARNVELLADGIRQGYTVIATEPAAVLALTHEYLLLLPNDEDAQLVAEHTHEACQYLWQLHLQGTLKLDFAPLAYRIAHHTPCHIRALDIGEPAINLLRLVPELRVAQIEKGCSGMAGTFGMQKTNYRRSLRAGLPLLTELRNGGYQLGTTECSTCKIQMQQSAPQQTLHPIKLLAMSYGLLPTPATI